MFIPVNLMTNSLLWIFVADDLPTGWCPHVPPSYVNGVFLKVEKKNINWGGNNCL